MRIKIIFERNSEQEEIEHDVHPDVIDFISDIEWMNGCYRNAKYGRAEEIKDKLCARLDDIMRSNPYGEL